MRFPSLFSPSLATAAAGLLTGTLFAADPAPAKPPAPPPDTAVIAKQLQNPLSPLLRLNFNSIVDGGIDPDSGTRYYLNLQVYGGFDISDEWQLLLPSNSLLLVSQHDVNGPGSSEFGMGDMTQSLWLSPKNSGVKDFYWGAGITTLLPFSTLGQIGKEQWGIGPEAVIAWQPGRTTLGLAVNHIVAVAGNDDRDRVNATTINPFVAYDLGDAVQLRLEAFLSYDWTRDEWLAPVGFNLSKTFTLWDEPFSVGLIGRCFIDTHHSYAHWSAGVQVTWAIP